ncbi:MAG: hypothetical protein JWN11_708 [Hyphomicrobiales bacterium]|nr:hypothetical protein [Hyphomicrobiales bacterium]
MLKLLACALPLAFAMVPIARADDAEFGGFAETAATGAYQTDHPAPLPPGTISSIQAGPMQIVFEATDLVEIQKTFGGTVHNQGEAGSHVIWICYGLGQQTAWFYSDGEMAHGTVSLVALEQGAPLAKWGCAAAPTNLTALDFKVPGIGASTSSVTDRLGSSPPDTNGRLAYVGDTPVDGSESVKYQELVFEAHEGLITAVAASQITID